MGETTSIWMYFIGASIVVKSVMLLLCAASLASWTIVIQRYFQFTQLSEDFQQFEELFWSGTELSNLYKGLEKQGKTGLANVFRAGYAELMRNNQNQPEYRQDVIAGVERAMRVATLREVEEMDKHVGLLASIGSVSPYVGLFGTVWGIMASLQALGNVQHASIAMVAPGISEALVATAMGLFVAIPAVLAYNRLTTRISQFEQMMQNFQDEFVNVISRQMRQVKA